MSFRGPSLPSKEARDSIPHIHTLAIDLYWAIDHPAEHLLEDLVDALLAFELWHNYPCRSRPATARTRRGAANHMAAAERPLQPMAIENALT